MLRVKLSLTLVWGWGKGRGELCDLEDGKVGGGAPREQTSGPDWQVVAHMASIKRPHMYWSWPF